MRKPEFGIISPIEFCPTIRNLVMKEENFHKHNDRILIISVKNVVYFIMIPCQPKSRHCH